MIKIDFDKLRNAKKITTIYVDVDKSIDSDFVKKLREKNNYTQIRLAIILGVSKKSIEKWEQGVIKPSGSSARLMYLLNAHPEIEKEFVISNSTEYDFPKNQIEENYLFSATIDVAEKEFSICNGENIFQEFAAMPI